MPDAACKPEQRGKGAGFYTVVAVAALVLYVASSGPVYWLIVRFDNQEHWRGAFYSLYAPLLWLAERSDSFADVWAMYRSWLIPTYV
jgi:hypothetical protein